MKKVWLIPLLFLATLTAGEIVPTDQNATDMIYRLPLGKYTKWLCEAELKNGKKVQFVSVKSMMQVYLHQEYFKKRKLLETDIAKLYVQDYLTGRRVDAQKAFYVFGSRIVGPHGDDLIPFETEENAKLFMLKNGGTKILRFSRLSKGLIRYLDM